MIRNTLIATALAAAALAAQAQSASYAIDPTHTFATFEILHFGTSTSRGRFDKKEGTIEFDRAGKTGKLDITIDMASISTTGMPSISPALSCLQAKAKMSSPFIQALTLECGMLPSNTTSLSMDRLCTNATSSSRSGP